jgi:hypothetical protein
MPESISYPPPQAKQAAENRNGTIAFILVFSIIGGSLNAASSFVTPFEPALSVHSRAIAESSKAKKTLLTTTTSSDPAAIRSLRSGLNAQCAGFLASAFCHLDPRWTSWVKDEHGVSLESLAIAKESATETFK